MQPKTYLVIRDYAPNSAATNRFMGMLKTFSSCGIDVDVVFFCKDKNAADPPILPHVTYHKYWDILNPSNDTIKNILYLTLFRYLFFKLIKKGDTVYLYTCNELLSGLTNKKGIKVFHERTEHPLVSKMKFLNINKYLRSTTRVSGLFVISHGLKEYFCSIGVSKDRIHIINMTVDLSRFVGLKKKPTERYIAYCGKATNNKDGVDRLIKAFALISAKHPDVKLYIIGTPPTKCDESGNLELVEELGISGKVEFKGIVSAGKMPQLLKNAEVLALARPDNKQAQYGFPTKLGEYLLTGNPVVITSVGDIPKFLKDKENAILVSPESIEEFAERLDWTLNNPEEASEIGERGKQIALSCFNSEFETKKMIQVMSL